MGELLKPGQTVQAESARALCDVERFIGSGSQGEVYEVSFYGTRVALKWYYRHTIAQDPSLRDRLRMAVRVGPPSDAFLWPVELAVSPEAPGFGYLMALRDPRYVGLAEIMRRRVEPSFRALVTAGMELAHGFLQLHARGLCYRDISFGNVFLEPHHGSVLIADNDNVGIDGESAACVLGTPRFMAPEVVRGEAAPNRESDLFSLSVLLFYLLIMHHPLEGAREAAIHSLDLPSMRVLYGTEPVFIFDPDDDSNRPVAPHQENARLFWPLYPGLIRDLFTQAFTVGLRDPKHGRVAESVWREALARLRDLIVHCPECGLEAFYDHEPPTCWGCGRRIAPPPRLRLPEKTVMLDRGAELYPHHLEPDAAYDFSRPLARVVPHPVRPDVLGLRNDSGRPWKAVLDGGREEVVAPGRSVRVGAGVRIRFGEVCGEVVA